ncbi:MAG: twin-arginine translocase TatA/TatE family subunit [Alphaproteobacteria bacterium]|nr:twin-arginine translocase TatA/TatE family subunit [Alphaproteobacteria bacterium]
MLDFSWPEIFTIVVVALVVIGPQDIPKIMHGLGRFVRRLQYVRFALSQQFDDFMKDNDLEDIRQAARLRPDHLFDEAAADEEEMTSLAPLPPEPEPQSQHEPQHERTQP